MEKTASLYNNLQIADALLSSAVRSGMLYRLPSTSIINILIFWKTDETSQNVIIRRYFTWAGCRFSIHIYKTVFVFQFVDLHNIRCKIPHAGVLRRSVFAFPRKRRYVFDYTDFLPGSRSSFTSRTERYFVGCESGKALCIITLDYILSLIWERKKSAVLSLSIENHLAIIADSLFCNFFHNYYPSSNPLILSASFWIW